IEEGFRQARGILLELAALGLPTATEILDPIVPQYLADMISWASIGARTAASQVHRQMASGFSMPIGFKNSVGGDLGIAIEGIKAARNPHAFLGITHDGRTGIATTRGNQYGHLVLRGGVYGPNYQSEYVAYAEVLLKKSNIQNGIVVDCSHANCHKDFRRQPVVFGEVLQQVLEGNQSICGMMIESFLEEGCQPLKQPKTDLRYGVSITDPCLGWNDTAELIRRLAKEMKSRH
ncbi:TPA: 3-deoxy-7-phosphoheptulonate synthase, partial [Candidatus Sumerlaeota bacterium]|nr:3-deoxy-7-phosphoheptulonate synthase [Candidatus Sumerlaeota bacterium]